MTLADRFDAFLLDLDGVVWRGEEPVDGVAEAVTELRELGKRVVFVTNNSSKVPRDVAAKLIRHKIPTPVADIVTSAHAVLIELGRLGLKPGDRIHVCAAEGLARLLATERFEPTAGSEDVRAVVVGWNPQATFEDVRRAADLARSGLPFVASNDDATYPTADGLLPGAGALLAAIETAAGRKARIAGKPWPDLFRLALGRAGVAKDRALYLGDRPETDVVGARNAHLHCALVLSGVVGEGGLAKAPALPDDILDRLEEVLHLDPAPPIERRKGGLVVKRDHRELAAVEFRPKDGRLRIERVRLGRSVDDDERWPLLRRLLAEAVRGAEIVEAPENLLGYLRRIGAPVPGAQDTEAEDVEAREPVPGEERPEPPKDEAEGGETPAREDTPTSPEDEPAAPEETSSEPQGRLFRG